MTRWERGRGEIGSLKRWREGGRWVVWRDERREGDRWSGEKGEGEVEWGRRER